MASRTLSEATKARNAERSRLWYQNNKDRHAANIERWARENPERIAAIQRRSTIKGKYGIKCVRAILCHRCNTAIGLFNDSVELLAVAISYLRQHEAVSHGY